MAKRKRAVRVTHEIRRGKRRSSHRSSPDEGLFGVKKQQFGRTRSPHGKKKKITFNKLVFDPIAKQAVTVRRFITKWK